MSQSFVLVHFEARWACLPVKGNTEKYGFIRIMTVPGIWLAGVGLGGLSLLHCPSGSKDSIGVCVVL